MATTNETTKTVNAETPHTQPPTFSMVVAAAAALPPLAADAVMLALGEDEPVRGESVFEAPLELVAAREQVASHVREGALDDESPFVANSAALASAVLALADKIEDEAEPGVPPTRKPCTAARANVSWFLEEPRRSRLLARVACLLEDVRYGVALEGGKRQLVHRVRGLMSRVGRLHSLTFHVDARGRLLLGDRLLCYRRELHQEGDRRRSGRRYLSRTNREGKLLILVATGRSPGACDAAVTSRVRSALRVASRDQVTLDSELKLNKTLRLTAKARRAAASVRHL